MFRLAESLSITSSNSSTLGEIMALQPVVRNIEQVCIAGGWYLMVPGVTDNFGRVCDSGGFLLELVLIAYILDTKTTWFLEEVREAGTGGVS